MGSLRHLVAVLVPDEKLLILIFVVQFFSKNNETSFIRDQFCHLEDDGSPLLRSKVAGWGPKLDYSSFLYQNF